MNGMGGWTDMAFRDMVRYDLVFRRLIKVSRLCYDSGEKGVVKRQSNQTGQTRRDA